jgi:hypothetical protein
MPGAAAEQPRLEDITECLFFSPGDGRIWLNDQRMMLMHTRSFGSLRRELIDALGLERARGLLTRAGYESGARDAQLVRERWPDAELVAAFRAYFTEERHREDVAGTEVEDVAAVDVPAWLRYIEKNPIKAWTGANTAVVSPFFSWQKTASTLVYTGPRSADPALAAPVARAVRDRALARLDAYWQRPGPTRLGSTSWRARRECSASRRRRPLPPQCRRAC